VPDATAPALHTALRVLSRRYDRKIRVPAVPILRATART